MTFLSALSAMAARSMTNGINDTGLSSDPFFQLKRLSETGGVSDKILRGFFIGVAIGIPVALACCCWYPCLGRSRQRRRARQDAALQVPDTTRV